MADGSINIDLLLNDQTDKTWSEFKSKAETAGKSGYDKFKDAFKGDPLVAKLETKANKAGIKNFRELLNQLPKEKQTELLTKAEKGEVINYEKLLREIPSKITSQVELNDNASTGLRSLKNQAEEVGDKFHRLKDIAIGTFVGSTISAGVRTVAGFISGLGQEALNSSDALQKFKSTMQLGGFGEDEIDKATKQVKKYADDTVYDLNTVSNTTAQLAANGVKDYLGLTEAAGNLNAQAGGNADTFKSVAMVLTQTAGAGKLTTENWNQMADAIPGASGVLQKALKENGAFTGNFRDAMADGQITADEFNDALTKLGSNDAAKKAATSTNTFEGAWGSLEANVVSGLDNMINKIGKKNLTGIINQLADVSTNAFGAMGKAVANVFGYINDHKKDITGILNSLKEISGALIGGAWDVAKDTITGIASAFGLISKDSKKAHNPLKNLNDVLGKIAEHKSLIKALGAAIATAFAIKKVSDFVGATKAVITNLKLATLAQKAFNLATKANPLGLVITALIALGAAFYELYKHNEKFKGFVDGIVKSVGNAFGKVAKVAGDLFNLFKEAMKPITDSLIVLGMSIGEVFGDSWKALTKAFKPFVTLFKSMFDGVGERISKLAKPFEELGGKVGKVFSSLKDSLKDLIAPFTHAGDKGGPIQAVVEKLDGISQWFIANKKVFTDIAGVIGKVLGAAFVALGAIIRGTFELIVPLIKPTFNILVATVKGTLGVVSGLFKALGSTIALILDVITGNWKHVGKDVKGIVSGLGKIVTSILKSLVIAVGNIFHGLVKVIDKALWGLGTSSKPLEHFAESIKKILSGLGKWFENVGKSIGSGSNAIGKWFDGLVKGFIKGWNAFVNTAVKLAKGFGSILMYALSIPIGLAIVIAKRFVEPFKNIFNALTKWAKNIWNPIEKVWKNTWNVIEKSFEVVGKLITKFLSNEINAWKKIITIALGIIVKVWTTTWNTIFKILKLIFGAIWKLLKIGISTSQKIIRLFMSAIVRIWQTNLNLILSIFKFVWNSIVKFFKPIIEWLSDVISDTLKAIKKVWNKTWDSISDFFSDTWNGMKKFGSKAINSLKDTFDDVLGKIGKSFGDTWTGVKNGFSDMWDGMKKLAGDGINAVIKIPNAGIDGINGLIHDFGGPKNALGKIPKVKFANGTGAINQLTHAILNDGNDSPETGNKETLIHPNGKMEIVQGRNTERLLLPGTEVLNASETAMMMGMSGAKHFANGTGFLGSIWDGVQDVAGTVGNVASSAWDGIKNATEKYTKMFDFITNAVAHPVKTLENVFNPKSSSKLGNMMGGLATGSFKHVKNQATDWWKSLWSLAGDEASGGGGASELLSNAVKYGTGKPYVWGATGPDSFDCSGLVQYTLKQMGKSFPHYSGDQFNASNSVGSPKSGDLAFFGGGGSQHVGIYAGNGKMFSAMSPSSNPNIGYANISNWSEKLAGYHRVPGLKSDDEKKSSGNSMTSLIRSQVGGMFDWIKKFIAPTQESSSEPAGDGVGRWTSDVKKALSKLGLSSSSSMVNKVLKQIQTESSGNAKAIGGNDGLADGNATGLMQVKPGTFKAYAVDGHNNIMNGYDNILAGLNYAKHRYGSDLSFLGQGHGYANGGRTNGIGVVGEVQGEDEWVTNPNRSTADTNIIGSIKETAQKQPNSFAAKLAGVISGAKSGMQAITSQQPIIAGSSAMQSASGGIDLSGDVHMTVQLDSGEIARATYPKIKVLQNQEIQMKGQVTGNTYVY
ncbi:tape measure protein [Leuconostoc mesenteroides]|uniref:tape measure protein n=1 Tax=Leuconostoc mesenteroides TaxID=1245 RepID=UPI0022E5FB62|nr:tape measure protein [Leuconostoc mesenteroides]